MTLALTVDTWARLSALFDSACEQPPQALDTWLLEVERDEPALAPRLREMLAADAARRADDWLERGPQLPAQALQADADAVRGLAAGARIGPWQLIERLGSGGMATVWRAVRTDALPAREVALKLPLVGIAAGAGRLAQRFAREQDILARLEHPHIARLYDAGVADDGTPWLAMECVQGEPIDTWCDSRRLGVAARLALFTQVLAAVQYAHARLVIHRDLKPSNILITEGGQVRLLDFGIARLLAGDGERVGAGMGVSGNDDGDIHAALTQTTARVMTPAYAAPEQVLGEPLTIAVDVYALGVVLFRLLAGRSPYRLKLATPAQLEAAVAEADVQRASGMVSDEAAQARGCSAAALRRTLAGDLDTMLAKALARDPARRYASVAALADDITRYLDGRPVAAQPDAALYRWRKALARHRWQAAAGAATLLSLMAGAGLALWQAGVATRERNSAVAEAERSNALNFFYSDLLEAAVRADPPVSGRELVSRAEALARREFVGRPDAMASVFMSIGLLHVGQGRPTEGRAILEEAFAMVHDPSFRDDIACELGLLLDDRERAVAMLSAVADRPAGSTRSRAACLVYLGDLQRADDPALAEQRYRRALADWAQSESQPGAQSPHDQVTILGRLAYVAALQGRTAEAVQGYERALALADGMGREASAMGVSLRNRLGRTWLIAGAPQRALPMFEHLLDAHRGSGVASAVLGGAGVASAVHGGAGSASAVHGGASAMSAALPPADLLIYEAQALLDLGRAADALAPLHIASDSASAAAHAGRQWQAHCLMRWAAAQAGKPVAPAALAASAPSALDDALTQATCALAEAQVLRAASSWPELLAHLDRMLAHKLPEPQWAIDALLLRAEAQWQTGHRELAAADARQALEAARRLQVCAAESPRIKTAEALLARFAVR